VIQGSQEPTFGDLRYRNLTCGFHPSIELEGERDTFYLRACLLALVAWQAGQLAGVFAASYIRPIKLQGIGQTLEDVLLLAVGTWMQGPKARGRTHQDAPTAHN
jgi:hypothetical protein